MARSISAAALALAATLGAGTTAVVMHQPSPGLHFPSCASADSLQHVRAMKFHGAWAANDSVYTIPIVADTLGFPMLDTAHKTVITPSDSVLAIICTTQPK